MPTRRENETDKQIDDFMRSEEKGRQRVFTGSVKSSAVKVDKSMSNEGSASRVVYSNIVASPGDSFIDPNKPGEVNSPIVS